MHEEQGNVAKPPGIRMARGLAVGGFPRKPIADRAMFLAGSGSALSLDLVFQRLFSLRELEQVVKGRAPIVLQSISGVTGAIDAPVGEQGVPVEGVIPLCCHDGISKLAGRIAPRFAAPAIGPVFRKK